MSHANPHPPIDLPLRKTMASRVSRASMERGVRVGRETTAISEQQSYELERRIAREHAETLLDEALGETFPSSDPISITPRKRYSK